METRAIVAGMLLLMSLMSLSSAAAAVRWHQAAEPCVWISNPLGGDWLASAVWNVFLAGLLGTSACRQLMFAPIAQVDRAIGWGLMLVSVRAVWDAAHFFWLVGDQSIASSLPIPLSLLVVVVLVVVVLVANLVLLNSARCEGRDALLDVACATPVSIGRMLHGIAGLGLGQLLMILAHVLSFGSTDYRREADVAVVLGAKVYPDGTLSLALSDRLHTAVELFESGLVHSVLVSGATGVEGVNEADAMHCFLLDAGVPDSRIIVDPAGVNTLATARHASVAMRDRQLRTALVVSHYFHLARCKLLFEEQAIACVTVPARMSRRLPLEPYYVARECAGYFWYALMRPLRPRTP